ncbi:MAG: hypothetical protein D6731_26010 [Planctomycetota bacterium]|nr:MAG: hypothetical protein D6731_26010 [Planctomycetota bacterium]
MRLPRTARRAIARRLLLALGALSLVAGLAGAALALAGRPDWAKGSLAGHILAQVVTATWTLGALATFGSSQRSFLVATVGALPLRLLWVLGCAWTAAQLGLHLASFVAALVPTLVAGHVLEAWTFGALAAASEPPPPFPPERPDPVQGSAEKLGTLRRATDGDRGPRCP